MAAKRADTTGEVSPRWLRHASYAMDRNAKSTLTARPCGGHGPLPARSARGSSATYLPTYR
jgi:hypothetical protein